MLFDANGMFKDSGDNPCTNPDQGLELSSTLRLSVGAPFWRGIFLYYHPLIFYQHYLGGTLAFQDCQFQRLVLHNQRV